MGRVWREDEALHSASLYRRDIHATIMESRGITQNEVARELGSSRTKLYNYLLVGGTEEIADQVDQALTAISDRRGLAPERAVVPVSGLHPDGLPEVATPGGRYREELRIRDLMKAPGREL